VVVRLSKGKNTQKTQKMHFEKKISEKKKIFASPPLKLVTNYVLEWMGLNFYSRAKPEIYCYNRAD
jgi:hypothetical protein